MNEIRFTNLRLDGEELDETLAAVERVLRSGMFVLGREVESFEDELAAATGTAHAVGVGNGTDALILGLRALGVGPGDEVIVPAFTAFPTVGAVLEVGASPRLVDIRADKPVLDLTATLAAVTRRTAAVILVHLYGIAADAEEFSEALTPLGVALIEDCAQAQGALLRSGRHVGTAGRFGAFSFYPTKNLGAVGDGGALVTADTALAGEVRAWRSHGERTTRYRHELPARNSRLDEVQAAVLRLRLARLAGDLADRSDLSRRYDASLPSEARYTAHSPTDAPHLAVIRAPSDDIGRGGPGELATALLGQGVQTGRHYPLALSDQPALTGVERGDVPNAAAWARECLSLPLHRSLTNDDIARVCEGVTTWFADLPGR